MSDWTRQIGAPRRDAFGRPIVDRLPFQIYDPSTDIFIASATTREAAVGVITDLVGCGYVVLQLFKATDDDTETLLETARWVDGHVEWESVSNIVAADPYEYAERNLRGE